MRASCRKIWAKAQGEGGGGERFGSWRAEGVHASPGVDTHSAGKQEPEMEGLVIRTNIYFILRAKEHM